jgi:hypothetical protein
MACYRDHRDRPARAAHPRPLFGRRRGRALAAVAALAMTAACATSTESTDPGPAVAAPAQPQSRAERIAALEIAVAADHQRLRRLIAAPQTPSGGALRDEPELRAIAGRLPKLESELAALRRARDAEAAP